jgi:hypothetical protein
MGAGSRPLVGRDGRLRSYSGGEAKLKRGARGVSHTEPADSEEDPRSRERLKGEGRSPDKALLAADPNL